MAHDSGLLLANEIYRLDVEQSSQSAVNRIIEAVDDLLLAGRFSTVDDFLGDHRAAMQSEFPIGIGGDRRDVRSFELDNQDAVTFAPFMQTPRKRRDVDPGRAIMFSARISVFDLVAFADLISDSAIEWALPI